MMTGQTGKRAIVFECVGVPGVLQSLLDEGDTITPGETIGQVVTARDAYNVVAPHGGRIIEWLVSEGDPVSPGQPLVRLHPKEAQ